MASRIEFAVSATPIFTHAAGEGVTTDVIAADVGKTVGGKGSATVTWGGTGGYEAGVPSYLSAAATIIGDSRAFVFLKHTGYAYSSPTVLGAATNATVNVLANSVIIGKLAGGEAMIFPLRGANISLTISFTVSSGTVAIEYFETG